MASYARRARVLLSSIVIVASSVPPMGAVTTVSPQQVTWVKRASGLSADHSGVVKVDLQGNSYVAGSLSTNGPVVVPVTFGPGEAGETILSAYGGTGFVAKYSPTGSLIWARQTSGESGYAMVSDLAIDGAGNVFVTGGFEGAKTFGLNEPNETSLASVLYSDIFIAKYNSGGRLQWAKKAGGPGDDRGHGIDLTPTGGIYLTGYVGLFDRRAPAVFDPGGPNETAVNPGGGATLFVARYDDFGRLVWVKSGTGSQDVVAQGIAVDDSGHSHITGLFNGTVTFGRGEAGETTYTAAGGADVFLGS